MKFNRVAIFIFIYLPMMPIWSANSFAGLNADNILVIVPERQLDATRPTSAVVPVLGLLQGLIATAIVEGRQKRAWLKQRELLRPLSDDPEVKVAMETLRTELARAVQGIYAEESVEVEVVQSEAERERREIALAPKPVLSIFVVNEIGGYRADCGRTGTYLVYGTGAKKQTMNIKRKPIEVYVPRPERRLAVFSEWCLPGVGKATKDGLDADETRFLVAHLLPLLSRSRSEVLDVLQNDRLGEVGYRTGTHGSRSEPYFIAEYGRERTLIANPDHSVLKWVSNDDLAEIQCNNACGPLRRAQAAEHVRRKAWADGHPWE